MELSLTFVACISGTREQICMKRQVTKLISGNDTHTPATSHTFNQTKSYNLYQVLSFIRVSHKCILSRLTKRLKLSSNTIDDNTIMTSAIQWWCGPIVLDGGSTLSAFMETLGQHSTVMLRQWWAGCGQARRRNNIRIWITMSVGQWDISCKKIDSPMNSGTRIQQVPLDTLGVRELTLGLCVSFG